MLAKFADTGIETRRYTRKKSPKIENARDRSLWRFNLDHSQYSRCCVLRLPQWPPSSFRWRCYLWLRWLSELRLASAPCTPARPVANLPARIGFVSFGSTGCKPPTRIGCSALPFDLRRSIKLAPDDPGFIGLAPNNPGSIQLAPNGPFLRLGRRPTSDSHRTPSFGSAGGFIRLAPHAAPAPRLAPPPVCTGCFTLRLHRP